MAKKKRKKIASRGSVNDIILKTLVNGDKYGYEIIKEVEEYSEGKIQLKQPSLYSSLSRFEEKGLVNSYWGDSDIGGRRHYYHLTEEGKLYYENKNSKINARHNILSHNDEENESKNVIIEDLENNELKDTPEDTNNKTTTYFVEDIDESNQFTTNNSNVSTNNVEIEFEEIPSIPAVIDFPQPQIEEEQEVIPDHIFHKETPIEKELENNIPYPTENLVSTKTTTKQNDNIWKTLANKVKLNNKKYLNSKFNILYFKKSKVVILDKDGIYKLRDKGYQPDKKTTTKIIDNVGKRIEPKNVSYMNYSTNHNKNSITNKELTDEERKIRNENFLAKFNSLTKSKMKPVTEIKVEEKPKIEIDYRKKLDAFISNEEDNDETLDNTSNENASTPINNLYNYVDEDNVENDNFSEIQSPTENIEEDIDDKFINFEPIEFETKAEDKKYIEEISQFHSSHNDIKINRYESKSNAILSDKSYVLINKVKSIFGIILFIAMALEVSLSLVIFKNNNALYDGDKILFIIAYALTVIIPLIFILPVFFSPNEHKINTFKLKYSIIFGILTFLVSIILIYCINSLIGFDLTNFKYFAVKIILPIVLTFNFVIMPPIYSALIKNKKFYD